MSKIAITEEMHIEKEWFEQAKKQTEVMKYQLILLKDLPNCPAGTVVKNLTFEQLKGEIDDKICSLSKELRWIYSLRNFPEWVKIEECNFCDCFTNDFIPIRYQVIGYGRSLTVNLDFKNKEIYTRYDFYCDQGSERVLPIKYCPLCGRAL